jgi:hypothetical protein
LLPASRIFSLSALSKNSWNISCTTEILTVKHFLGLNSSTKKKLYKKYFFRYFSGCNNKKLLIQVKAQFLINWNYETRGEEKRAIKLNERMTKFMVSISLVDKLLTFKTSSINGRLFLETYSTENLSSSIFSVSESSFKFIRMKRLRLQLKCKRKKALNKLKF